MYVEWKCIIEFKKKIDILQNYTNSIITFNKYR